MAADKQRPLLQNSLAELGVQGADIKLKHFTTKYRLLMFAPPNLQNFHLNCKLSKTIDGSDLCLARPRTPLRVPKNSYYTYLLA